MRPEDRPVSAEEVRALVERLRKTAANVSHRSVVEREAADALAALAAENERLRHELSVERTHNDMIGKQLESLREAGPERSTQDEDDAFDRYRDDFPNVCEAWDNLHTYVRYRAYGPDDLQESRAQEWNTTALRLNKLGQRIRGAMDRALGRNVNPLVRSTQGESGDAHEAIDRIAAYEEDWDSYGAPSMPEDVVRNAHAIVDTLKADLTSDAICPYPNGIAIELEDFTIHCEPQGENYAARRSPREEPEPSYRGWCASYEVFDQDEPYITITVYRSRSHPHLPAADDLGLGVVPVVVRGSTLGERKEEEGN